MSAMPGGTLKPKAFSWSFSKLKNFETCGFRHLNVDLLKTAVEAPSEALNYGNQVHGALAAACGKGVPLPDEFVYLNKWVKKILAGPGALLVEQKYAIMRNFGKCSYFAPVAWYRGIGDIVRLSPPVALILDWKTGKIKEDSVQLALMAQCIFSHYPDITHVRSEFVWLAEDCTSPEVFTKQDLVDMWPDLLRRVELMEHAAKTNTYPKKPGGLCVNYCPVTSCEFHGKGTR